MARRTAIIATSSLASLLAATTLYATLTLRNVRTCFSPDRNCHGVVIEAVDKATKTLDIAVYSLTHPMIAEAILRAKDRGVYVRLLIDGTQAEIRGALDDLLAQNSIPVKKDKLTSGGLMHHKFTIIDGKCLTMGSYNFTENATSRNAEDIISFCNRTLAREFSAEFEKMWANW